MKTTLRELAEKKAVVLPRDPSKEPYANKLTQTDMMDLAQSKMLNKILECEILPEKAGYIHISELDKVFDVEKIEKWIAEEYSRDENFNNNKDYSNATLNVVYKQRKTIAQIVSTKAKELIKDEYVGSKDLLKDEYQGTKGGI